MSSECPIEYNEDEQGIPPPIMLNVLTSSKKNKIETWNDRAYVHKDGKFQKEDERMEDNRMFLMGRITHELQ
jgi:hypothetical protein